jgi:hypothetical protein
VDDDDRLFGYRDNRDSLSDCLFQAPTLACHSRSFQSDMWDLLSLVSAVPNDCMLISYAAVAVPLVGEAVVRARGVYLCRDVPYLQVVGVVVVVVRLVVVKLGCRVAWSNSRRRTSDT